MTRHLRNCVFFASALLSAVASSAQYPPRAGGPNNVFTEYFDQAQPNPKWTIYSESTDVSFRWQRPDEQPGFHYFNQGHGWGYAPWSVGSSVFDLKFDVTMPSGMIHPYVRSGVFVALSTNPPDNQGPNDISVVIAVQAAGPGASVRKGPLFGKDSELSNLTNFQSNIYQSILWPNADLSGTQLTMEMQRLPGNVLMFSFFRPDYKNGLEPWWTKRWTMPANLANVSFNTVIVETLNTDATPAHPPQASYAYPGWVSNIHGYVPGIEDAPAVSGAAPADQSYYQAGAIVNIAGQGFQPGVVAYLGNQYLNTTYVSPSMISVTLPDLPMGTYRLKVINPGGLEAEAMGGITYSGPAITRVDPREASPAGGDTVTLVGQGFDASTQVAFNDQPAAVVQLIDNMHLQVQVPPGNPGVAAIKATGGNGAFSGNPSFGYAPHPYMHFTADTLPLLQQQFLDPRFADYRTILLRNAAAINPQNPQVVGDFLWPYLFGGDPQMRQLLFQKINLELPRLDFTDFRLSDAGVMATAYDALFAELTPAERTAFLGYLDRAETVYNQMRANQVWFLGLSGGNVSNTVAIGNSGGGQVAVATMYSTPGAPAVIAEAAKRILVFANKCITPDGGDIEGTLYWNYGLTWYLQLGHILKNALGDDRGLLSQPNLAMNYRFLETAIASDGYYLTFNDTEPQLYGMAVTADLGARNQQPLMLWMADYLAHQSAALNGPEDEANRYDVTPYAFLWRGSTAAPAAFPGVPTTSVLSTLNWGTLRSSGDQQPNLFVAVKGGATTTTQHAQNDMGGFVLQAGGENFFIDPGYYQPSAPMHSVPIVDGVAPANTGATVDSVSDRDGIRSMAVDSTRAYGGKVQRVRRLLTLYADRAAVVLDDIVPGPNGSGAVASQFQTGFPAAVTGAASLLVSGVQTQVQAAFNGPALRLGVAGPNNFGNSWVFKANRVQWYSVTAGYVADPQTPLITVISPSMGGNAAVTATVTYGAGQATVTFSDGQTLLFRLGDNGWRLAS